MARSNWLGAKFHCLFLKGNGDALDTIEVSTEQVMKILERIVDGLIRQMVYIDDS